MRLLTTLGALLVLLASAATACAAPRLLPLPLPAPPLSDPVFAGDGAVAWAADAGDRIAVLRADADGTVSQIATLPSVRTARFDRLTYRLDVSAGAVAVERVVERCDFCKDSSGDYTVVDEEYAGAPGGPLAFIGGCGYRAGETACGDSRCQFPGTAAVAGAVVAVVVPCAGGDPARDVLELRPADGTSPVTVFATDALALWDLTDDLILTSPSTPYGTPLTVTLRRWPSGEVVLQHVFGARSEVRGFRIGPDATIAYLGRGARGDDRLSTLSAGGSPRDLGKVTASTLLAVGGTHALLDDGRIVSLVDGTATRADFAAIDGRPDYDGAQLAYRSRPCLVETIVVQGATAQRPAELRRPCPPPDLDGAVRRAGRNLAITLSCPPAPYRGCAGQARVALPGHLTSAHAGFRIAPGRRRDVHLSLGRAARRFLAAHPRPRVNVRLRAGDPDSLPDPTGPLRVVRRTLTP